MSRSDRQEIAGLTAVSTGHGSSRPNSKKRPRDDERVGGGRNPNPFSSLSRNNLHEPKRVTNTQTSSVTHSGNISNHSLGFSRKKAHTSPLANRTFPEQSTSSSRHSSGILNGSGSFTPDDHESTFHSELLSFANGFTNQTRPSPPLTDLDRIILGQRECERDVLPMADFWNSAPPPDSPPAKTTLPQPSLAQQPRSSSSDPIDLLANSGIPNIESTDPIVVDDDDDEIPIRQPRSRTPNRQTQFKPGYVKEKVREANSHSAPKPVSSQPTIVPYLASSSSKPPLSANVPTALPKSASSSKGQPIPVGISRKADSNGNHSSIIRNMKAKPTKPQSGLKLASVGLSKDVSTSKAKESSQKQQPNPPAIPSADAQMKVQEWYCANQRHGASENVRQKYMLCFTKNHIVLRHRQALGDQLMLLKWDLVGFEVAEASEGDDKQEFIPALVITVTEKFASSPGWQRFSGQDTYPRVVVLFDTSDEAVTNDWSLLVSHLETMMPKSVVRIGSMKKLIKLRMEANLPAQQTARSTSSIPTRAERSEDLEVVPAEVPPTMHGPSTRTRTKAGITRPKDEAPKTPPRPPLKDPDEIMLVYPRNGPGAVNINRAELARLEDGEFLNDTLIELGLKLWINGLRAKDPALADEIHVFNSFFFKKLDGGRSKPCDYSSVKKWTAKIDLFKKKFVVVPINEHLHWYLAIICFPENVLQAPPPQPPIQPTRKTRSSNAGATQADGSRVPSEGALPNAEKGSIADGEAGSPLQQGSTEVDNDLAYRSQNSMVIDVEMLEEAAATPDVPVDPEAGKSRSLSTPPILDMTKYEIEDEIGGNSSAQKCWIVIFDSLRGKHGRTIRILREYLQAEAQERHGKIVDTKSAESSGGFIVDKHLPVPEQPNWCDCGVYVLHYVEAFTANPLSILTFPVSKRKLSPDGIMRYNELWRTEEVKKKRENFRSTVNDLSTEWREFRLISTKQPPDAHYASLLPNAGGELSVMEISPPGPTGVSKEFENNPPTSPTKSPPRTGILPMLLIDEQPPLLPGLTSSLHSDQDQDEKEVEAEVFNPDDGTKASDSSNSSNKRTRRGLKGGIRHNTRRHSLETPSSPEL